MRGGVEVEGFRGREGEGFGRQSVPFRVFPRQRKQETGSSPWHGLKAKADRDLVGNRGGDSGRDRQRMTCLFLQ